MMRQATAVAAQALPNRMALLEQEKNPACAQLTP